MTLLFSCLSCEHFAAAADQHGEGKDPAVGSLKKMPSGFIPFLACMAKCWVEPAPCIVMCFFSGHSSFAEDMPLATGAPRSSTG